MTDRARVSITPTRFTPRADHEQILLALADGSFVLAGQTGAVAECGAGTAALLGVAATDASGRDVGELLGGEDHDARREIARLLAGGGEVAVASGERRLSLSIVPVPLALGWDFTALLTEVGTRDPAGWSTQELAQRHTRALDAIAARPGGGPGESEERIAGVLIMVRERGSAPLRREDVQEHVEQRRIARAAAGGMLGLDGEGGALSEVVEHARELRTRLHDAERDAEAATSQLEVVASERDSAAAERDSAIAERDSSAAERDAARAQLAGVAAEKDGLRRDLDAALAALRDAAGTQQEAAQGELDAARAELRATMSDRDTARVELHATAVELEAARSELQAAISDREAIRGDLRAALGAADTLREEFGLAPADTATAVAEPVPSLPHVSGQATAYIAPNGRFERLDAAFCAMLGYREEELRVASWPSIIDRANLEPHQEIARRLRAGEIASAEIETCYMHAHGLLVPVAGTISVPRGEDARAGRLLFRVDLSRTRPGS